MLTKHKFNVIMAMNRKLKSATKRWRTTREKKTAMASTDQNALGTFRCGLLSLYDTTQNESQSQLRSLHFHPVFQRI